MNLRIFHFISLSCLLPVPIAGLITGCSHELLNASLKSSAQSEELNRTFYLMGTSLDLSIKSPVRSQAILASEKIFEAVKTAEDRLSTWKTSSELTKVNHTKTGQVTPLSRYLYRDLKMAYQCGMDTHFAFNPWMGPLIQAWGLRKGGKIPSDEELQEATAAVLPSSFEWTNQGIIRRNPLASVEEGGFGKGIGLDDALDSIKNVSIQSAVLNFGGQISILGEALAPIEVSDPEVRDQSMLRFLSGPGSVSTSGNSEHGLSLRTPHGTMKIGHILDPQTGKPASYFGSVTVFASSGFEADCLSTALFVMGADQALQWANQKGKAILWIVPGKQPGHWIARTSCAWKPKLEKLTSTIEIQSDCTSREESYEVSQK